MIAHRYSNYRMENSLWWALMMGAAYSTVLTSWSITQWYMSGRPEEKMHKVGKWQGLNQCLAKTKFWSLPMTAGFGCTTYATCRCLANTKDTSIAAVKSELHLGKSQCLKSIQNVSAHIVANDHLTIDDVFLIFFSFLSITLKFETFWAIFRHCVSENTVEDRRAGFTKQLSVLLFTFWY